MPHVRVLGAGSIGNHLAHGCRKKGWNVEICDIDGGALERTKNDIYPARYGSWDGEIELTLADDLKNDHKDIVIVGTPPEHHISVAIDQIQRIKPRIVLIEKPLCTPSLERLDELQEIAERNGCRVLVGYNHTTTPQTTAAEQLLADKAIGEVVTIDAGFREYWGGIFAAHPWLDGPKDSYLGFWSKGGGATGEHSHAINIWQHFAHVSGKGRILKVAAMHDMVETEELAYDRVSQMVVETESGLVGNIVQDVITEPAEKKLRIQGDGGSIEWLVNYSSDSDAVLSRDLQGNLSEKVFKKTRPDDFRYEIEHMGDLLENDSLESPISLARGIETMLVIAAAYKSSRESRGVSIDYSKSPQNALS